MKNWYKIWSLPIAHIILRLVLLHSKHIFRKLACFAIFNFFFNFTFRWSDMYLLFFIFSIQVKQLSHLNELCNFYNHNLPVKAQTNLDFNQLFTVNLVNTFEKLLVSTVIFLADCNVFINFPIIFATNEAWNCILTV